MGRILVSPSEGPRTSTWFWPVATVFGTTILALALTWVRPDPDGASGRWLWPGDAASAETMLQVMATSVMTAATVASSLTVVALQLASQQYSPRLLREFARDAIFQGVLALFVATFAAALVALWGIDPDKPLPAVLIGLVLVMGFASACGLLAFLGHIVKSLRVESMMAATHREAIPVIIRAYPAYGQVELPHPLEPGEGTPILAKRNGFIREVDDEALVNLACKHEIFLRLNAQSGDDVARGTPVGVVFGEPIAAELGKDLDTLVGAALDIGFERTSQQDSALGLRRLTDIAVKAISPAINDPVTASNAVGHCTDLLMRLQDRQLGPRVFTSPDGEPRLVGQGRDLRYFLDLVCGPIRRFGRREPLVLMALLQMLRDCATAARDDDQRCDIAQQVDLVVDEVPEHLLDYDRDSIQRMAESVRFALAGDTIKAYADRAGETRST
ncbi:DUF2254 domain-containing protein [Arthrobacter rhombi]|uniref:DUF2254 domain-containing protein n=1 Tax=Arthrobacter rhombi TaxID=71253 RepID=UPI003FD19266